MTCLLSKETVVTAANFKAGVWETNSYSCVSAETLENWSKSALMNHFWKGPLPWASVALHLLKTLTFWRVAVTLSRPVYFLGLWWMSSPPLALLFLRPPLSSPPEAFTPQELDLPLVLCFSSQLIAIAGVSLGVERLAGCALVLHLPLVLPGALSERRSLHLLVARLSSSPDTNGGNTFDLWL